MKKLQSNYTTPEQSKRLLEMGLPADSADCMSFIVTDKGIDFFDNVECGTQIIRPLLPRDSYTKAAFPSDGSRFVEEPFPCWSAGRLIEIMKICAKPKEQATMAEEMLYCKDLVELLVYMIEANKQVIDFSKLNEL